MLAEPLGLADRLDEFLGRAAAALVRDRQLVVAEEFAEAARVSTGRHLSLAADAGFSQEDGELEKAVDFFAAVGATRYLRGPRQARRNGLRATTRCHEQLEQSALMINQKQVE